MKKRSFSILMLILSAVFLFSCADNEQSPDRSDSSPTPPAEISDAPSLAPTGKSIPTAAEDLIVDGIAYTPVSFDRRLFVEFHDAKGILCDLNGDGTEEKIHYSCDGLKINGEIVYEYKPSNYSTPSSFYDLVSKGIVLIDIDRDDGLIEVLMGEFDKPGRPIGIFHYADEFYSITNGMNLTGDMLPTNDDSNTFVFTTNPEFIDNNRIKALSWCHVLDSNLYYMAEFELNSEGLLSLIPSDYEIRDERTLTLTNEIELYSEKDLNGSYIKVSPQTVALVKTDAIEWIYLVAEDGSEGWVHCKDFIVNDKYDKQEYFQGFNTAG